MKGFLFVILLLIITSCSNESDKVVGKWKLEQIDYSAYFAEVSDEVREFLEGQMEEEFAKLKDKTFFEFTDNNKLKLEAPNYSKKQTFTSGSWQMNEAGDSLFLQLAEKESYKIITLTEKEMVLSTDEAPKRTLKLSKVK